MLRQLGNADGAEAVGSTAGQGGKANHEEVKTREWDHVDGQFAEIRIKLAWEAEAGGDARHDDGDEMVQVAVGWSGELESSDADVVESLD